MLLGKVNWELLNFLRKPGLVTYTYGGSVRQGELGIVEFPKKTWTSYLHIWRLGEEEAMQRDSV